MLKYEVGIPAARNKNTTTTVSGKGVMGDRRLWRG